MVAPDRRRWRRNQLGSACAFTLIEVLLVLAIVAVVSAIAAPRFASSVTLHRVEGAAHRVAADLELAREHAMATSASQTVTFQDGADPGYTLVGLTHPDHPDQEYTVSLSDGYDAVQIISVDFDGDAEIVFDMYGRPDSGGGVRLRVGDHYRTVEVDEETGRASVSE